LDHNPIAVGPLKREWTLAWIHSLRVPDRCQPVPLYVHTRCKFLGLDFE